MAETTVHTIEMILPTIREPKRIHADKTIQAPHDNMARVANVLPKLVVDDGDETPQQVERPRLASVSIE